MAEKRGETEKLRFDFNTAGALEIFMNDKWTRVTATDFRSFNGKRRITEPTEVILGNVNVDMKTYEYFGPVYQFRTNKVVEFTESGSIEKSSVWDNRLKISQQRG